MKNLMRKPLRRMTFVLLSLCFIASCFYGGHVVAASPTAINQTVALGQGHSMAIKNDGTLWSWGWNEDGQLGDGTSISNGSAIKIMDNVVSIAAGGAHSYAIKNDGTLWAWGNNTYGQLGNGTTEASTTPVKIMESVTCVSAAPNGAHVVAVKTDGTLWAWGYNKYGQIGDGTKTNQTRPVKIMDNVATASAGGFHTLAIKRDGTLWAWGLNDAGRLGDGTTTDKTTPIKVMDNVAFVSGGGFHSMAIKDDGTLWAWGDNTYSQLGDMTTESRNTPVQVLGNTAGRVLTVSAGAYHTVATTTKAKNLLTSYPWEDDEIYLFAWGRDENYQIGSGNGKPRQDSGNFSLRAPIKPNIAFGVAGATHTVAVQNDGVLLAWGNNEYGQLGTGYPTDKMDTPTIVLENVKLPSAIAKDTSNNPVVETSTPSNATASPTTSTVLVNGSPISFGAYMINDNNYFKLRDFAMAVSGSIKQFDVQWREDINAIELISSTRYTSVGVEFIPSDGKSASATPMTSSIYKDGVPIYLTAYNINGNNYFKLRDLAGAFNIGVTWDAQTNSIKIDTQEDYVD